MAPARKGTGAAGKKAGAPARKADPKAAEKEAVLSELRSRVEIGERAQRTFWITQQLTPMLETAEEVEDAKKQGVPLKELAKKLGSSTWAHVSLCQKLAHSNHMKVRASAKHGWLAFTTHKHQNLFLCEESTDAHTFICTHTNQQRMARAMELDEEMIKAWDPKWDKLSFAKATHALQAKMQGQAAAKAKKRKSQKPSSKAKASSGKPKGKAAATKR